MENEEQKSKNNTINEQPLKPKILCINFNQDHSCIAVGTETGFKIININPFKDEHIKDLKGGIGLISMLNRSNILLLVGGGKNPKFPPNKLIVWDEEEGEILSEINFSTNIINIKMKEGRIFVICLEKIYIFDFDTLNLIDSIETNNTKGLLAIATKENIIVFPEKYNVGCIRIKNYDKKNETMIHAHKKNVNFIELNSNGCILATASLKGTFVRIFNTTNNNLIQEVRRGKEPADVFSISFDFSSKYFVVASDRPTIHIFFLNNNNENMTKENVEEFNKSIFGGNIFEARRRFFGAEWRSFAKYYIDSQKSISTFGPNNSIIVITGDGRYIQASFDPVNGGECQKILEKNF